MIFLDLIFDSAVLSFHYDSMIVIFDAQHVWMNLRWNFNTSKLCDLRSPAEFGSKVLLNNFDAPHISRENLFLFSIRIIYE